jgi:hypothetical protein
MGGIFKGHTAYTHQDDKIGIFKNNIKNRCKMIIINKNLFIMSQCIPNYKNSFI